MKTILQQRPENISRVSFVIHSHLKCITHFWLMGYLGSIHHHMNETELKSASNFFFPLRGQKALIFLMSWAPSAMAHHSESDTFIINYTQAVWWYWTLAWGKQWVVAGSLMLLGCTGNHIDYHSCFFWISLHHPLAIFSIIFHLGRQMMEMAGSVYGAYLWHSRDSIRRFSIVSITPRLANGRRHITVTASTLHPPPSSLTAPPGRSGDNIYFGWLKLLPNNTLGSG